MEQVHLKGNPKRASEPEAQQKFEAEALLGTLDGRDYVVVLDERGSQFTSFDLAHCIATAGASFSHANFWLTGSHCCLQLSVFSLLRFGFVHYYHTVTGIL